MILPFNSDEAQVLQTVRTCVASKASPVPHDDIDLADSGALDSMAWVDTLISIESATGIEDFGNPWPENRPKSIRALAELILTAQRSSPGEGAMTDLQPSVGADGKTSIAGWAFSLGSRRLSADQIEYDLGLPPHKIRDGAGIDSVCLAADTEDELVLAQKAAEIALEMAEVSVDNVDFLVVTSATFLGFPSLAASLHSMLLMRETTGALDVGGACTGLIYSLAVAKSLVHTRPQGVALVVAAEVHSRRFNAPQVPGEFRGLFGDGACACVLTNAANAEQNACVRLQEFVWGCSGTFASSLGVKVAENAELSIQFKGEQLAHAAVAQLGRIIGALENLSGEPRSNVDYFAIHQPNPRVVEILAEKAKIPMERIPMVSTTCGNLGSVTCGASLCQALTHFRESGNRSRTPLIFMAAVAPGLVWGGAFLN
jgi:3-oxoacyl-[acyl-carrier-protein] synthase III